MKMTTHDNERGAASIIVTMIMMIVISLIVLGFAQIATRNQRENLDRQVASQAFYAAESGINDVLHNYATLNSWTNDNCSGGGSVIGNNTALLHPILDSASNTRYTCLNVTDTVQYVKEEVTLGSTKVVTLKPTSPTDLTFQWDSSDGTGQTGSGCPTTTSTHFSPVNEWTSNCHYGVLRVDLYDATDGSTSPATMANDTATVFIVPSATGGSGAINFGRAAVVQAKCVGTATPSQPAHTCAATLPTGSGAHSGTNYYARLSAVYEGLGTVWVKGATGVKFPGTQLVIDSTGQSQDQVKRLEVRYNLTSTSGVTPDYALESAGRICKRYTIIGTNHKANDGTDADIDSAICSSP